MDAPAPVRLGAEDVFQLQGRLAEEGLGALLLQSGQAAQQRLPGSASEQRPVLAKDFRIVLQMVEQRLQVLQVEQQQAFPVATWKAANSAACWLSVNSRRLASSSGPISLMVVRNGWPVFPAMSQSVVG